MADKRWANTTAFANIRVLSRELNTVSWHSFCQKLIFFLVVTALVLALVVLTGVHVTVALGAAAAVAVVVRDMLGPQHGGMSGKPERYTPPAATGGGDDVS
ncbi:hypothetical protein [Streptomyces sp. enrichment culture]|uniref:hypothetical protein n=1 Tax=Streptomyces sp. enrichment culture TaxID=1795815 RepID=UPI003F57F4E5